MGCVYAFRATLPVPEPKSAAEEAMKEARESWLRNQPIPTGEATEVSWEEWMEATKETP
jgi:hypothetical protein